MDIALALEGSGEPLSKILEQHHIVAEDLVRFNQDKTFLKKVEMLRDEVREKGLTFRLKAKAQAEELLTTSWRLIHSADVSAAVKADLIKSTVKWGGLEPVKDAGVTEGPAGGVTIQINMPSEPEVKTIEHKD